MALRHRGGEVFGVHRAVGRGRQPLHDQDPGRAAVLAQLVARVVAQYRTTDVVGQFGGRYGHLPPVVPDQRGPGSADGGVRG